MGLYLNFSFQFIIFDRPKLSANNIVYCQGGKICFLKPGTHRRDTAYSSKPQHATTRNKLIFFSLGKTGNWNNSEDRGLWKLRGGGRHFRSASTPWQLPKKHLQGTSENLIGRLRSEKIKTTSPSPSHNFMWRRPGRGVAIKSYAKPNLPLPWSGL